MKKIVYISRDHSTATIKGKSHCIIERNSGEKLTKVFERMSQRVAVTELHKRSAVQFLITRKQK